MQINANVKALELVNLSPLMRLTSGRREIIVGLLDGPVLLTHPDLADQPIVEVPAKLQASCSRTTSFGCMHATFVAGILAARRGSVAPAICPGCTIALRPIFPDAPLDNSIMPSTSPEGLAEAIFDTIEAGARVLNISAGLAQCSIRGEQKLQDAIDFAARHGVVVVAAAGNQGTVGSSAITRHPWVISVVGCNIEGKPTPESNLGASIGRWGLRAPGEDITSLGTNGKPKLLTGTSVAAPFVSGALALLWSEYPRTSASELRLALTQMRQQRNALVPPLMDAWAAYQTIASSHNARGVA